MTRKCEFATEWMLNDATMKLSKLHRLQAEEHIAKCNDVAHLGWSIFNDDGVQGQCNGFATLQSSHKVSCFAIAMLIAILGTSTRVDAITVTNNPSTLPKQRPAKLRPLWNRLGRLMVRFERLKRSMPQDTELERDRRALAQLKLEKAQIMLNETFYWWSEDDIKRVLDEAQRALSAWERGEDMVKDATGLVERAYLSQVDGSAQPFWIYVPRKYRPERHYPLVVFLHGYDPSINKAYPWLLSEDVYRLADKYGIVILQPHGRKNTDFIGIGEQDVLIALKKTLRYYAIDKRRVYLLGVSMGGYGAYAIGLHHPHYFAAIAVVAARRYHFLWGEVDRTPLPPPRAQVLKAENPWMLAENATNLPILIIHGENDTLVPVANAFLMARRLSKLGCPVRLNILRNESHWIYFNSSLFRKIFDWFRNKSNSPFPKHVVYRTYTTAYNRCYWLKIDEIAQWGKPANIRASALANGTVYVNTQNVARLTIELNPRLIAPKRQARLILNGVRVWEGELTEPLPLTRFIGAHTANRTDGDDEKLKLAKTQELCGPVWHAYTGPFLIVHGTLGTEAMRLANYNKARQLALEWVDFSDGLAHIKADRDVTEEDLARYHIIAVGGPQENSIVKRAVHSLPIKFAPKGYTIGAHTLRGKQLGLVCIYPNPLNPRRYLVIYDGVLWGRALPINHKFDTLPDFAIFTSEQDADGANVLLCAGFFDSHWQVDERLIWCVQEQCPAGFQVNN